MGHARFRTHRLRENSGHHPLDARSDCRIARLEPLCLPLRPQRKPRLRTLLRLRQQAFDQGRGRCGQRQLLDGRQPHERRRSDPRYDPHEDPPAHGRYLLPGGQPRHRHVQHLGREVQLHPYARRARGTGGRAQSGDHLPQRHVPHVGPGRKHHHHRKRNHLPDGRQGRNPADPHGFEDRGPHPSRRRQRNPRRQRWNGDHSANQGIHSRIVACCQPAQGFVPGRTSRYGRGRLRRR